MPDPQYPAISSCLSRVRIVLLHLQLLILTGTHHSGSWRSSINAHQMFHSLHYKESGAFLRSNCCLDIKLLPMLIVIRLNHHGASVQHAELQSARKRTCGVTWKFTVLTTCSFCCFLTHLLRLTHIYRKILCPVKDCNHSTRQRSNMATHLRRQCVLFIPFPPPHWCVLC